MLIIKHCAFLITHTSMNFFHLIYEHPILSLVGYLTIGYLIATKSWDLWTKPGHDHWVARLFFPGSSFFTEVIKEMDGYWSLDRKMLRSNCNKSASQFTVPAARYTRGIPLTWQGYKSRYFGYTISLWPLKVLINILVGFFLVMCVFTEWCKPYKEPV